MDEALHSGWPQPYPTQLKQVQVPFPSSHHQPPAMNSPSTGAVCVKAEDGVQGQAQDLGCCCHNIAAVASIQSHVIP